MIGAALCRLGWHDPDPAGRWNSGYCFTACRRCGRDMVRSAFGEWRVPRGFRVVWGPKGSVADLDEALTRLGAPPPPEQPSPDEPRSRPSARRAVSATPGPVRSPFDFDEFDDVAEGGERGAARRRAVSP